MRTVLVGVLAAVLMGLAPDAAAELYRWRDPQTGSIKYSSYPPPWFGDEAREANAPKVEVLSGPQAGGKDGGKPADEMAEKVAEVIHFMEQRREQLLARMTLARASAGFDPATPTFQADLQAYRTVSRELDKFDPRGTAARRRADASVFENLGIDMGVAGNGEAAGPVVRSARPESARQPAGPPPPEGALPPAPDLARPLDRPVARP
jgi:hypothetical protein